MTQDQAPDVHTMFAELTQPHSHREPYVVRRGGTTWTQHHVTRVPALVMQLLEATPAGSGDQAGTGGHSRPAIRIEALDTVMLIDDEVSRWIERLGSNTPADVWDVENDRPVKAPAPSAHCVTSTDSTPPHPSASPACVAAAPDPRGAASPTASSTTSQAGGTRPASCPGGTPQPSDPSRPAPSARP